MGLQDLLSNPDYTNANEATKTVIFEKYANQDPDYLKANEATKQAIQTKFGIGKQYQDLIFESGGNKSVLENESRNPLKVFGQSLVKGVTGLGDIATQMNPYEIGKRTIASGQQAIQGNFGQALQESLPKQPITELAKKHGLLKAENEPNTSALGVLDFTGQLLGGGGINPTQVARTGIEKGALEGSKLLGRQLGMVGGQGLLGGGTNELLKSSGWGEGGRIVPTMAAMGVPGAIYAARNTPSAIVNQSMRGLSPEDLSYAENIVKYSHNIGQPVTGAEALGFVKNGSPLLGTQRIVENTGKQAPTIMSDFMAKRTPENQQNVLANFLRQISPNEEISSAIPKELQGASQNVIKNAEKQLTQEVSPYYTSAGKMTLPKDELTGFLSDPIIKDAVDSVRSTSKYKVKGFAENDFRTLQAAKDKLDDLYKQQTTKTASSAEEKASAYTWEARQKLDSLLAKTSPEYAQGRDIYRTTQKNQIEPLQQGQVGQLADTVGIKNAEEQIREQSNILMPKSPRATNPNEIAKTVQFLRNENPNIVQDWTRQNLQGIFNETAKELQGKQPQFNGAKFASEITGNKQQTANLQALVSESASPEAWDGFNNLLTVFKTQGQRLPAGSATSFNNQAIEGLQEGGVPGMARWITNPMNSIKRASVAWQLGINTEMLAKMLTDPESIQKLEQLSKVKPDSRKAQNIVNTIVGGTIANKSEIAPVEENKGEK